MSGGRSVGYLFTDIDGSVAKWERTPGAMKRALARHDDLINRAVAMHGGAIQDRAGDGVFVVFEGGSPLACALDMQRVFRTEVWDDVGGLAIRIGIHAATEHVQGERDRPGVNRTRRMMDAAWGGQTVVSALAAAVFGPPVGARLSDLGSVYLRGISEPQHLFALSSADLGVEEFPPLRGVARRSPSLPSQSTPIFGREQELSDLLDLIHAGRPWITITGAGGVGKTRLALEVASAIASDREAHLVMLNPGKRDDSELVLASVAALRLPRRSGVADIDLLLEYLNDKNVLLVIDNADGLAGGEDIIGKITANAKGVTVLATSREPFMSAHETVFKLGGLKASRPGLDFTASAAATLFAQSARSVDPAFAFTPNDAATFTAICDAVRGAPLALHLTAQWVSVLSLKEIAESLAGGAGLLSKLEGSGTRSLRDIFDGSWTLLNPEQREALAGLAIFPATFDAQAASVISGVTPATLQALERKNLLERRSSYRFALHPLIQEFATERLQEGGSHTAAATRHSEYYLSRVDEYFSAALTADQPKVAERLRAEFANMAAAWAWRTSSPGPVLATLAERTFYLYAFGAMFSEGLGIFSCLPTDLELRATFLALRANCFIQMARYDEAGVAAREALDLASTENACARGHAHHALANLAHAAEDWHVAEEHYRSALDLRVDDTLGQFYSVLSLAYTGVHRGAFEVARVHLQRSRELCDQLGFVGGRMSVHICAGAIAAGLGDTDQARAAYKAAIALEPVVDNGQNSAIVRWRLGVLQIKGGDYDLAHKTLTEALEMARAVANGRVVVRVLAALGIVSRSDPAKARSLMMEALRLGVDRSVGAGDVAEILLELARLETGEARYARATHLIAIVRALGVTIPHKVREELAAQGVGFEGDIAQLTAFDAIEFLFEEYKSLAR